MDAFPFASLSFPPVLGHLSLKMSIVSIKNVEFLNNPARYADVYRCRILFECMAPLKDDLEWQLTYVSSPGKPELDQDLDSCLVGPVPVGTNSFDFEAPAPDPSKVPDGDLLGNAALILTGSYNEQEFVRVGYYQFTEYDNEEMKENPPAKVVKERMVRNITTKPRVTRFQIKWDVGQADSAQASVSIGAAQSAAVPSADDLDTEEDPPSASKSSAIDMDHPMNGSS